MSKKSANTAGEKVEKAGADTASGTTPLSHILESGAKASGLGSFIVSSKNPDGKISFELTETGKELQHTYEQAFRLAEESGPDDRDVLALITEVEAKWPSHPGVVENAVNDAVEAGDAAAGVAICESALASWGRVFLDAGVKDTKSLASISAKDATAAESKSALPLFVQLLANYEFALERAEKVEEALGAALLSREIDPSDPENVLSSIVSLQIRSGNAMAALRALEDLQDSLAPYVLYGRALAYYALGQQENARGALQTALRHWPQVAQALVRQWKTGTPMPKPGEAVSELQILYGYYEVFGAAWKSVAGSIEWLREEERSFQRAGSKPQRYIGLTRSGLRTDALGNIILEETEVGKQTDEERAAEQAEFIRKAQLIGEDEFVRFLEVAPNTYVYELTERGKEQEEAHKELYRKDMKVGARIAAIEEMLVTWPGHSEAAVALARYHAQKDRFEQAIEILEPVIFDLQKFWPDDLVGAGRITADWPGNKPLLTAYAYMLLELNESGDRATAKAYADDYLQFNPGDNMGIRQKAIEIYISEGLAGDTAAFHTALKLIMEANDQLSAYNLFGRALLGYALKTNDMELALKNAVESRPLVWRELNADKHRMPHQYNPAFVKYFSAEEAYNYQQVWSGLWLRTYGALAWLKKEGKKYVK